MKKNRSSPTLQKAFLSLLCVSQLLGRLLLCSVLSSMGIIIIIIIVVVTSHNHNAIYYKAMFIHTYTYAYLHIRPMPCVYAYLYIRPMPCVYAYLHIIPMQCLLSGGDPYLALINEALDHRVLPGGLALDRSCTSNMYIAKSIALSTLWTLPLCGVLEHCLSMHVIWPIAMLIDLLVHMAHFGHRCCVACC